MSVSASGGAAGPGSGSGKKPHIFERAFGTWLPRLSKQELVEYVQWHIATMKNKLDTVRAGGKTPGGGPPIDEIKWHADAAAEGIDRIATAARKRSRIDLVSIIAFISLIIPLAVFIGTWASTSADNGGLHERVNALQDQVTALQGQLTDVRDLVDNQLEKGNISVQTVLQYVPNGQGLSLSGQDLVITSPARPTGNNPAVVPIAITVTGTINTALNRRSIWILISTPGINRFYPQGSVPDGAGPAILDANHQWFSPTVTVGLPGDRGRIFYVIAVLADPSATNAFWNYLKTVASTGMSPGLPQLPTGATEYDRVEVVRG